MTAKVLKFNEDARRALESGINKLADTKGKRFAFGDINQLLPPESSPSDDLETLAISDADVTTGLVVRTQSTGAPARFACSTSLANTTPSGKSPAINKLMSNV